MDLGEERWPWEDPDGKAAHTGGLKLKGVRSGELGDWEGEEYE